MSDFTYEYAERKNPLETYEWDNVRALQPNAVIFGSLGASPYVDVCWVGNERGIAGKPCFATIDLSSLKIALFCDPTA